MSISFIWILLNQKYSICSLRIILEFHSATFENPSNCCQPPHLSIIIQNRIPPHYKSSHLCKTLHAHRDPTLHPKFFSSKPSLLWSISFRKHLPSLTALNRYKMHTRWRRRKKLRCIVSVQWICGSAPFVNVHGNRQQWNRLNVLVMDRTNGRKGLLPLY